MPYPLDEAAEAALAAGRMASAILLDFYCADAEGEALTLRCWNWPGELAYPAVDHVDGTSQVNYEDMHRRMQVPRTVRFRASLASEPQEIIFDGSRAGDDEDFVGRLTDSRWHQRRVRIRHVLLNLDSGESPTDPVWEWKGRLDERSFARQAGDADKLVITAQGGIFRIRGRRMHTRTDADQKRRSATDRFFEGTPVMVSLAPIWARHATNIPGYTSGGGGNAFNPPKSGPSYDFNRY